MILSEPIKFALALRHNVRFYIQCFSVQEVRSEIFRLSYSLNRFPHAKFFSDYLKRVFKLMLARCLSQSDCRSLKSANQRPTWKHQFENLPRVGPRPKKRKRKLRFLGLQTIRADKFRLDLCYPNPNRCVTNIVKSYHSLITLEFTLYRPIFNATSQLMLLIWWQFVHQFSEQKFQNIKTT